MSYVDGKNILVTGGTGSIGRAIVKRLFDKYKPNYVKVLSRDVSKQMTMHDFASSNLLSFQMGDVQDIDAVAKAVKSVDIVIHAAACKHVPACEAAPREAIGINIGGSLNVLQASLAAGVTTCLGISTDKACEPISVMGMTKALMERLFQQYSWSTMRTICVRSGNVAGSQGSVIPLWHRQIERGGPITLTHDAMRRFFISIESLVEVIFAAIETGFGGDIFVPKMAEVYLGDLADVMTEHTDVEIQAIGRRPGEKLTEALISERELLRTREKGNYYVITASGKPFTGIPAHIQRHRATTEDIRDLLA